MNAARRKELGKALGLIEQAASIVRQVADEEREFYDVMPEGLKNGDRGEAADEAATMLEEKADQLEEMVGDISDIVHI